MKKVRVTGVQIPISRIGYVYFNIFKNFLFSSLQIVSSSHHNSEYEVRKYKTVDLIKILKWEWYGFFFYRLHSLIYGYYGSVTEQK
jgi:hypothetical protein